MSLYTSLIISPQEFLEVAFLTVANGVSGSEAVFYILTDVAALLCRHAVQILKFRQLCIIMPISTEPNSHRALSFVISFVNLMG